MEKKRKKKTTTTCGVTQIPTLASCHICQLYASEGGSSTFTLKYPFALWHLYLNACPTLLILAEALISGQL